MSEQEIKVVKEFTKAYVNHIHDVDDTNFVSGVDQNIVK